MKIIYNSIIPFKGYKAVNILGILFVRKGCKLTDIDINHENIHTEQIKEMLYVLFYIWYLIEWLVKIAICLFKGKNLNDAYYSISFEQEAYKNQYDLNYIENRKHYNWINKMFNLS